MDRAVRKRAEVKAVEREQPLAGEYTEKRGGKSDNRTSNQGIAVTDQN